MRKAQIYLGLITNELLDIKVNSQSTFSLDMRGERRWRNNVTSV